MATLSIPPRPTRGAAAQEPGPWIVTVDSAGIILASDGRQPEGTITVGASYYWLIPKLWNGSPERAAAVIAGIQAVAAGLVDSFSVEFPCRWSDREMRMRLSASAARSGSPGGAVIAHIDADSSQIHKMEALGRVAGGVAHDFANLVTLVSGYSEILLDRLGPQDASRRELLEIRKAAARGAGVTANILDFIRKQPAPISAVDLNALAGEMVTMLRPIIGEHIHLETALEARLSPVQADFAQMSRVIMNLVLNARDAMPQGGVIRIRTANASSQWVTVEVSDTGMGMDRETLSRIFEPFFTTKNQHGTGLGLHTVKRIVEQARGRIFTRSEPGNGSSFTICLPRSGQTPESGESPKVRRAGGPGTETILLAEDEESVRKLLHHLLDADGYRVIDAVDGPDALRLFEENSGSIDLLLTDIIMPGMNGHDLAHRILESKPGLKVIFMSGYTDDVLADASEQPQGVFFLRKPLKFDTLSSLVREALDVPTPS